jgi:hypothetical protein
MLRLSYLASIVGLLLCAGVAQPSGGTADLTADQEVAVRGLGSMHFQADDPLEPKEPTLLWEDCTGSENCSESMGGDSECAGITMHGLCAPLLSVCFPADVCGNTTSTKKTCVFEIFGSCGTPATGTSPCGREYLGICYGGIVCLCVNSGGSLGPCPSISDDCS